MAPVAIDCKTAAMFGSRAIRIIIERYQPDHSIVGRIHEGKRVDSIGQTMVINPDIFRHGGRVDIRINNSTVDAIPQ
jgi:uncharacterized protein